MAKVELTRGYIPGSIGRVIELHGTYYHEHWGFNVFFEAKVATQLAEFLGRYNEKHDGFWTASLEDRIEGSITIDGIRPGFEDAHVRWFIVSDALRGRGIGAWLISTAVDFCRSTGYRKIYLWTFEGLEAARHLYEKLGFRLIEEHIGTQWGKEVNEQRFELRLE